MYKKRLLFIFIVIGACIDSHGSIHADSLRSSLERPNDTTKINILLRIASVYNGQHNANLYIYWLKEALNVSLKLRNTKYNAICYDKLSEIMSSEHIDNPLSLSYAYLALQSYKESGNNTLHTLPILAMYLRIGLMYADIQHYEVAWIYLDSASQCYKKLTKTKDRSSAQLHIANFYREMNEYDKALSIINETYTTALQANNFRRVVEALRVKSDVLRLKRQYAEALKVNDTIMDVSSVYFYGNEQDPYDLNARGKIYFELNDYKKAAQYFNKSLLAGIKSGSSKWQIDNYFDLANTYEKMKSPKLAMEFAFKSLRMAYQSNFIRDIQKNYGIISSIYSSEKKYLSAYEYLKKYKQLEDSLNHPDRSTHISSAVFKNEIEIIRNHNIRLSEENQVKSGTIKDATFKNTLLIGILALMGVLIMFVFRLYVHTKKQKTALHENNKFIETQNKEIAAFNEKLKKNNEILTRTLDEHNDLIAVVSHDLKAPLSRAFGLVHVIEMKSKELSEEHRILFEKLKKELSDESNLISEILNAEALENELNSVNLELIDVNVIALSNFENYKAWGIKKSIDVNYECLIAKAIIQGHENFFRRIMDNLVSNAIKFSNEGTSVFISVNDTKNNIRVQVKDQGQGFNDEDKKRLFKRFHKLSARPTANENSTGLGLSIVKKLVEAMNGQIKLQSQKGEGATFTLEFPKA